MKKLVPGIDCWGSNEVRSVNIKHYFGARTQGVIELDPMTWAEAYWASDVGVRRRLAAMKNGREQKAMEESKYKFDYDIQAAASEMVLAKHMNVWWHFLSTDPHNLPGDVGEYQVRHTEYESGRMIIQKNDPDKAKFILLTGSIPVFKIIGWAFGSEAKKQRFWETRHGVPAFFMPQLELRDFATLLVTEYPQGGIPNDMHQMRRNGVFESAPTPALVP